VTSVSTLRAVSRAASKYFVVWVVILAGLALVRPDPFIPVLDYVSPLLGLIMLGMGLTLQPADFRRLIKEPVDIGIGAVTQWLVMPAVAYGLYVLLDLPEAVGIGLILVGAAPGGTASNVMTYLGHGDVALSVAITTLTTLAAPIVMPAWVVFTLGEQINVTFAEMFQSIIQIVIIPVLFGFTIRYLLDRYSPKAAEIGTDVFPVISVAAIVAIVAGVVAGERIVTAWPSARRDSTRSAIGASVTGLQRITCAPVGTSDRVRFHATPPSATDAAWGVLSAVGSSVAVELGAVWVSSVVAVAAALQMAVACGTNERPSSAAAQAGGCRSGSGSATPRAPSETSWPSLISTSRAIVAAYALSVAPSVRCDRLRYGLSGGCR